MNPPKDLLLRRFLKKILSLCMACIQERLVIKSGLWWRMYGILNFQAYFSFSVIFYEKIVFFFMTGLEQACKLIFSALSRNSTTIMARLNWGCCAGWGRVWQRQQVVVAEWHCTEVRFASFLSGGLATVAVMNPPEKKLEKRTCVHCGGVVSGGVRQKWANLCNFQLHRRRRVVLIA